MATLSKVFYRLNKPLIKNLNSIFHSTREKLLWNLHRVTKELKDILSRKGSARGTITPDLKLHYGVIIKNTAWYHFVLFCFNTWTFKPVVWNWKLKNKTTNSEPLTKFLMEVPTKYSSAVGGRQETSSTIILEKLNTTCRKCDLILIAHRTQKVNSR